MKLLSMKETAFPPGWNQERVRNVLSHYESQSEDEAVAEDEAAFDAPGRTIVEIPTKHETGPGNPETDYGIQGGITPEEVTLSPLLKKEIDRDIAISREQFENGQYERLDDAFMKKFLEEARERNKDVFNKINVIVQTPGVFSASWDRRHLEVFLR